MEATPITKRADKEDRREAVRELSVLLHPGAVDLDEEVGLNDPPARPAPLTDSSPCGFGPSLYCVAGPLDDTRVRPLRRKAERVHPLYRTTEGRAVKGDTAPGEPHYVLRNHGWFDSYYQYVEPGPVGCQDCGARFEMVALIEGRWVSMDTPGAHDAAWTLGVLHAADCPDAA